jgi:transposase
MMKVHVIGLDLAKNVFQAHGVDASGEVLLKRRLRRDEVVDFSATLEPTIIGIEAYATAHHWARELSAVGHEVRLMPPQFVKPYVKSQKNDAADAEAICEAVARPSMRFVPINTVSAMK